MPLDDEALRAMYGHMKEDALGTLIRGAVLQANGLYYHTHDSRRSDPGFPDCVIVLGGVHYRELKDWTGKLKPDQIMWRVALERAGADWGLWRPQDWGNGSIIKEIESWARSTP